MTTKMIKFDLQMKGVKVTSFDELQENFSADILPIFQTGRLAKWLMSRELVAQSEAIAAIDKNSTELQQLAAICRVLELDDDEEILQFLLDDRQAAQTVSVAASAPAADDVDTDDAATHSPSCVDWSGQDMNRGQFIGHNLRYANLKKTNFEYADLSQADLTGADLSGANLYGTNLMSSNLADADLSGANLYGANLMGANLANADLIGADLTSAKIGSSNFKNANLTNAKLNKILSHDLEIMKYFKVQGIGLLKYKSEDNSKSADFSCSNLTNASLQSAMLVSDNFTNANLTNASFENSVLLGSDFSGANLTRASLCDTALHNANFTRADLSFANLKGALFDLNDENRRPLGDKVNLTSAKLVGVINFDRPKGF